MGICRSLLAVGSAAVPSEYEQHLRTSDIIGFSRQLGKWYLSPNWESTWFSPPVMVVWGSICIFARPANSTRSERMEKIVVWMRLTLCCNLSVVLSRVANEMETSLETFLLNCHTLLYTHGTGIERLHDACRVENTGELCLVRRAEGVQCSIFFK